MTLANPPTQVYALGPFFQPQLDLALRLDHLVGSDVGTVSQIEYAFPPSHDYDTLGVVVEQVVPVGESVVTHVTTTLRTVYHSDLAIVGALNYAKKYADGTTSYHQLDWTCPVPQLCTMVPVDLLTEPPLNQDNCATCMFQLDDDKARLSLPRLGEIITTRILTLIPSNHALDQHLWDQNQLYYGKTLYGWDLWVLMEQHAHNVRVSIYCQDDDYAQATLFNVQHAL
jgi:hypothetical protein